MNVSMKWIDSVRGNDSIREVARKAGVNQATLSRQVNLDALSYDMVRDIARAYERPVLADLLTTGHLSADDTGMNDVDTALRAATDEELVLEVARRLDAPAITALFDQPLSRAFTSATNVHRLTPRNVADDEETAIAAAEQPTYQKDQEDGEELP